jgi:hypothetical protein
VSLPCVCASSTNDAAMIAYIEEVGYTSHG